MQNESQHQTGGSSGPGVVSGVLIALVVLVNLSILAVAVQKAVPKGGDHAPSPGVTESTGGPSTPAKAAGTVAKVETPAALPATGDSVVNPVVLPANEVIQALFTQHCAACHGTAGRGDGPAASQLFPQPRDFVTSPFRFAPNSGSEDAIHAAIERTISQGVPRSGMTGFDGVLDESEIHGLARFVLELRGQPLSTTPDPLLADIGNRPPITESLVARGAELFKSLGCTDCHGESGHGDGPNARNLLDSTERPIRPADLASGLYKAGRTRDDIAHVILAGVPGTPMISYKSVLEKLNPDGSTDLTDLWAVASYVAQMSPRSVSPGVSSGAKIVAAPPVDEAILSDPSHIGWQAVEPVSIAVRPLWQREESITHLDVRAVATEEEFAFCFEWRDDSTDDERTSGGFTDAVAVMFSTGTTVPAIPMGISIPGFAPEAPVNIWHWQASRQVTASLGQSSGEKGRWQIYLPPQSGSGAEPDPPVAAESAPGKWLPKFRSAELAGNIHADPALKTHAVLESNAMGFGSLTLQPVANQSVDGSAARTGNLWRVVMVRPRTPDSELDVDFNRLGRIPVSFAVWDGKKADRNGRKLISGWCWLSLSPSSPEGAAAPETANVPRMNR